MLSVGKMHFEISERKMILRLFDILFILLALFAVGHVFDFDYFTIITADFHWMLVLVI